MRTFVIWTKMGHPFGDMLRTQQGLSVLRDFASPDFFNKLPHRGVSATAPTSRQETVPNETG